MWLRPANEYYGGEHYVSNILVGNEEVPKRKKKKGGGGILFSNKINLRE